MFLDVPETAVRTVVPSSRSCITREPERRAQQRHPRSREAGGGDGGAVDVRVARHTGGRADTACLDVEVGEVLRDRPQRPAAVAGGLRVHPDVGDVHAGHRAVADQPRDEQLPVGEHAALDVVDERGAVHAGGTRRCAGAHGEQRQPHVSLHVPGRRREGHARTIDCATSRYGNLLHLRPGRSSYECSRLHCRCRFVRHRRRAGPPRPRNRLRLLRDGQRGRRQLALRERQRHVVGVPVAAHQHLAAADGVPHVPDARGPA